MWAHYGRSQIEAPRYHTYYFSLTPEAWEEAMVSDRTVSLIFYPFYFLQPRSTSLLILDGQKPIRSRYLQPLYMCPEWARDVSPFPLISLI